MHFTHSTEKKNWYIFYALVYQTKYDILLVKVTHLRLFLRYHKLTKEISISALLDHVNKKNFKKKLKTIDREQ